MKKKKTSKRVLAVLLTLLLVVSALPLGGLTTFAEDETYTSGDFEYVILEDSTAEITGYTGNAKVLEIPSKLDTYSVTSIGHWAFHNCDSLISVIIPESVTRIGDDVFYGCNSLTSVTIPESVTSIGHWAFEDCDSLTSVTIPESVTSIGNYAFAWCRSLTEINVNANNKNYTSQDGVLFDKNKTELIQYPVGNAREKYDIPNSVTSIGDYAFEYCDKLTSVKIGNSVTSIGKMAFRDCDSLTSVTISDSVTSIGDYAFEECYSLTSVTIPQRVISIGNYAFRGCDNLTEINVDANNKNYSSQDGVLFDKNKTELIQYPGANSNSSLTIPNSVIEIREYAFEYCRNLTAITVMPENTSYYSADGVLFNKEKTNLLRYPSAKDDKSYEIPDTVTDIAKMAFFDCEKLECLTISKNVKNIAADDYSSMWMSLDQGHPGAFHNNTSLKKIIWNAEKCYLIDEDKYLDPESSDYDSSVSICHLASFFPECTEFVIGDTVKYIPCLVLANNQNIKSVNIPDNVIRIQPCAFYNCKNLETITFGIGVMDVGYGCFYDTAWLKNQPDGIVYAGNNIAYTVNGVSDPGVHYYIKPGTKVISSDISRSTNSYVKGISIPASVTTIDTTFYGWNNLSCVCYEGTQEQWEALNIDEDSRLLSLNIHYNTTAEEALNITETVLPTHTESGYTKYNCTLCNEEWTDWKDAEGHSKGQITETVPPTCTSDGYTKYRCTVCGEEFCADWVYSNGHVKGQLVETVPPTCTNEGYTKYRCSVCGEEFETDWTYLEHSYDILLSTHTATCTERGYEEYRCTTCSDTARTYTEDALGHNFSNDICKRCGMLKADCLESDHPYRDDEDNTWTLTKPGSQSVAVTFSADTYVEDSYDYIYIYDAQDTLIGQYTGDALASQRIVVLGDTVKIRLTSDDSYSKFGFALSKVEVDVVQELESDGVVVSESNIGTLPQDATLVVNNIETTSSKVTYDISLMQNGMEIRPNGSVTVKIPVPETMDGANVKVYRQEVDGTLTDMHAIFQDGYAVFTTDHFSIYVLTSDDLNTPDVLLGDINGDGEVDAIDARWVLQASTNSRELTAEQEAAADVNADSVIDAIDARWILQASTGSRTF